ncbi:curli production assembly/transport component CsgF [Hymenobacter sp. CRA2]|uniref:curli production assembly/transport component CsgF n=1 Tax=Hymenobacter sp. CRA2 TaxID=1955620 RepID=UPI00098FD1F8|nr:curli production assembly/transport component CsgF [Hymenobacter sp. CRA2]OON68609.1 hypothetical protein B0919_13295 [Hymenobacter sp. CRA2]
MKRLLLLCWGLLLGLAGSLQAQDLVYEPKNPSFGGGNPYNYSWLLSSATAQNTIEDPSAQRSSLLNRDPLVEFQENLNRQILNLLTTRFVTSQFGEGQIREGSYNVGSYQIQVTPGSSGVVIQITDTTTGGQTTVTIPNMP